MQTFGLSGWLDVFKALAGAFSGAFFAYLLNLRIQRVQRDRGNLAAGNLALAVLSKQYGDFLVMHASVLQQAEERKALPSWLQLMPSMMVLSESLKFDLATLAFLFEDGRHDVLTKLILAETCYQDLRQIYSMNTDACRERDRAASQAGIINFGVADIPKLENVVDASIRGSCRSFCEALKLRGQRDQTVYLEAGTALYQLMVERFGTKKVMAFAALGFRPDRHVPSVEK